MKNILGILLLFFVQLFFLNLGINGTLSRKDKRVINDSRASLLKWLGWHIWRLEGRKIYKVILLVIYLNFLCNTICIYLNKIYETNIIQTILDKSIKLSFILIPFLIIVNLLLGKK